MIKMGNENLQSVESSELQSPKLVYIKPHQHISALKLHTITSRGFREFFLIRNNSFKINACPTHAMVGNVSFLARICGKTGHLLRPAMSLNERITLFILLSKKLYVFKLL